MARRWRAFHAGPTPSPGARIALDAEEAHHVQRVLRLREGDRLDVFDGNGHEWSAVIESTDARSVTVSLGAEITDPVEAPLAVVIYQALCRADRFEWLIQKATELGVCAIHPLTSELCGAKSPSPAKLARWRRIAVEACKQSGRRRLPRIEPASDLPAPPADPRTTAILLDARAAAAPLGARIAAEPRAVWIAVGPESGFTEREISGWIDRGWQPAALGPRTLRTETAGLIAAAIVLHAWGDLGRIPASV